MITNESPGGKIKGLFSNRIVFVLAVILAFLAFLYFSRGISIILTILIQVTIFSIITMSLNLESGYAGIPQFGRVAAVIAGAFAVGAIPGRIMAAFMGLPAGAEYASDTVNFKLVPEINALLASSWLVSLGFLIMCLVLAALSGALIGWLISRPAIRLKEGYLGISMLAIGDFFMWVGHNWNIIVGGSTPVNVPDPFRVFGTDRFTVIVPVFFVIAILIFIYLNKLTQSPFGRNLRMLRDNDLSANAAGLNIVKVRTQALVIGAAIAAIGGGLYVIYTGSVAAIGLTRLTFTFWPWAYMMLGGIGSNIGVFLGVFLLTILRTMIIIFRSTWFGFLLQVGIDPLWLEYTLLGAVIIIVILFMPHGLVPEKIAPMLPSKRIKKVLADRQAVSK
ncbi:MAG: branched-chain amino acid ABC transporter permease [Firmicutes bacterium]|nr:branched-chain amino acid ABC transporter permease [Bacillota bacterium]